MPKVEPDEAKTPVPLLGGQVSEPVDVDAKPVKEWRVERVSDVTFGSIEVCLPDASRGASTGSVFNTAHVADALAVVRGPDLEGCHTVGFAKPGDGPPAHVEGWLLLPSRSAEPGHRVRFVAEAGAQRSGKGLRKAFLENLCDEQSSYGSAYAAFAQAQLRVMAGRDPRVAATAAGVAVHDEAVMLSGFDGLVTAMGLDAQAWARTTGPRTVRLESLEPRAATDPVAEYTKLLAKAQTKVPSAPLATLTPEAFYLFGIGEPRHAGRLLRLLERGLGGGGRATSLPLTLGLRELGLTLRFVDALKESTVTRLAVVGSDPFFMEGTDSTVIFEVADSAAFDRHLAEARRAIEASTGPWKASKESVDGVDVALHRSTDGSVRQLVARVNAYRMVSNSLGALRAVLAVQAGKAKALSASPDFRWLTTRLDPSDDAGYFAFGEAFVAHVTSPAVQIARSRRLVALGELQRHGYAELLFRSIHRRAPKGRGELEQLGYLARSARRHRDGGVIDWKPGSVASSRRGTARRLPPLIDEPLPTHGSKAEVAAYREFRADYDAQFELRDPALTTVALEGDELRVQLFQHPPSLASGWLGGFASLGSLGAGFGLSGLQNDAAGAPQFRVAPLGVGGGRLITTLPTFHLAEHLPSPIDGWVAIGALDRAPLLTLAGANRHGKGAVQGSSAPDVRALPKAPLYAMVHVRSPALLATMLTVWKAGLERWTPSVRWTQSSLEGTPVDRIAFAKQPDPDSGLAGDWLAGFEFHFAVVDGTLIVALQQAVLRTLIREKKAGGGAQLEASRGPTRGHLDLDLKRAGALVQALGFLTRSNPWEGASYAEARAVLHGTTVDERSAVATATLGYVPTASNGQPYALTKDGVADPLWGTPVRPIAPRLPVPGSPLDRLVGRVRRVRADSYYDAQAATLEVDARFELWRGARRDGVARSSAATKHKNEGSGGKRRCPGADPICY